MTKKSLLALVPIALMSLSTAAVAAPTPTPTPTPSATPSATATPATADAPDETDAPAGTTAREATPEPAPTPTPTPSPTPSPTPTPAAEQSPATARALTPIGTRYEELGGATGWLGTATSPETSVAGGAVQEFVGGNLYWSPATGVRFVRRGPLLDHYRRVGGPAVAGFPTADERSGARSSQVVELPSGRVLWSGSTGAYWVHGLIFAKYRELGAEAGFLGLPNTDELAGGDGRSRISNFSGGTIVWHPEVGAYEVHGLIRTKWVDAGAERGILGVPTTDELAGNDGGRSRVSVFRGGTVIYTPGLGAHEVHGTIRERYVSLGREGGVLGAPTSDEFGGAPGARVNRFERGLIIWRAETGAWAVRGALLEEYARHGWENGDLGAPTGNEFTTPNGWGQDFQNGRLLFEFGGFRVQPRLNVYIRSVNSGDVRFTYRSGCPVGPGSLRVIEMNYLNYDGRVARGLMIVRDDSVDRTIRAFQAGADGSFPIAQMVNPDVFGGDDPTQMRANNTSAFNCRSVVGNPYATSPHSYGRALDVNTVQNPYYDGRRWWPENGTRWIDRGLRDRGMLFENDPLTRGLTANGYFWGGWWANKDYQHFQVN